MIEKKTLPIDWRKLYRAQGAVSGAMFAASIDDWTAVLGREPRRGRIRAARLGEL